MRPTSADRPRPASAASRRPVSSVTPRATPTQTVRPSSSQSIHHPYSGTIRPSSSQPSTSQGIRPVSSASMRPISRLTARPQSRQLRANHLKIVSLCEQLVRNLQGDEDETEYHASIDYATRSLSLEGTMLNKVGVTIEQVAADRTMGGHVQKARIQSHDALADALETSYKRLKENFEKEHDLDQEIKALPSHLQLLFCLANAPESSTSTYASSYLFNLNAPPPAVEVLTWKKILEDDPFEGEHWEGVYGMPPGSIKNQREPDSDSDASSLWSLHSDDIDIERSSDSLPTPPRSPSPTSSPAFTPSLPDIRLSVLHRKEVEDLQARQYWRSDWRMPVQGTSTRFDIGNASTLGPTLQNVMGRNRAVPTEFVHLADKYIYEHDAVREVLIALQGRSNVMLHWQNDAYQITSATPRLLHLSLASQASILASLGERCTCLKHLRNFVTRVFSTPSGSKSKTRTLEAFADAVDAELRLLDTWCAEKEEQIVLATNGALPGQASSVFGQDHSPRASPSTTTAALLDRLFAVIQENLERGERITAGVVMRVFIRSSEPLWSMVGQWLKDGMGIGDIDDEFFIESNGLGSGAFGVGLLDPDYWTEGYTSALRGWPPNGIATFFGNQSNET
ncbi:hypothetical protein BDZ89DRAFT_1246804 [Hymenopellis radicata]|nr:hypothetical protein BDZ89DRAFT_1246804 [Hymenopellis radicata]